MNPVLASFFSQRILIAVQLISSSAAALHCIKAASKSGA